MENKDLIPGKWYTEDTKESQQWAIGSIIKFDRLTNEIWGESYIMGDYGNTPWYFKGIKLKLATEEEKIRYLPKDHPDRVIPDIKDMISNFLDGDN